MKKLAPEERQALVAKLQEDDRWEAFIAQLRGQLAFLRRDWTN